MFEGATVQILTECLWQICVTKIHDTNIHLCENINTAQFGSWKSNSKHIKPQFRVWTIMVVKLAEAKAHVASDANVNKVPLNFLTHVLYL